MDWRSRIIIRVGIALTCIIWVWYGGREKPDATDWLAIAVIVSMGFWEYWDRQQPS
jgi:hypothetical protein